MLRLPALETGVLHILNTYHVPSTVLRARNIIIKNMCGPNVQEVDIQMGGDGEFLKIIQQEHFQGVLGVR